VDGAGDLTGQSPPPPPRPPVADRLLLMFGYLAGAILVMAILLSALLVIFRPNYDVSGLATLLNTQLSLIIGAVLGYAAHPNRPDDR
jgi:hypothetical protein